MPTATYAGHDVAVNDEGFLTDPRQWTEEMAPQIASSEGIGVIMNAWDVYGRQEITEEDIHREMDRLGT